jgi:hypothetical protein
MSMVDPQWLIAFATLCSGLSTLIWSIRRRL